MIESKQLDRRLVLRILTLSKSREACKGGNMMRDIGAYFYCAKIGYSKKHSLEALAGKEAVMSQLGVVEYWTINDEH